MTQDIRNQTNKSGASRLESAIKTIVRHHSATTSGDYFAFWNNRWKGLGWRTGGYHEIILRDGTVQLCYDPAVPTNGVKSNNGHTYHICVVGDGNFTEAQEKAFDERCKLAMKRFDISVDNVKGHGEIAPSECPGIDMNIVRERLKVVDEFMKNAQLTPARERMRQRLIKAELISEEYEIKEHEIALLSVIDKLQQKIETLSK